MSSAESTEPVSSEHYQVVARKYRPQNFAALIGQGHIATALSNAINQSRVGHAYLFTGARGVGKTSSARIFAKCLNCVQGPTTVPCDKCDICEAISVGEDVDVLEIDGASNRGIDEIRSLRSNAAIRPSRARYKIYIIDEVHMLTTQAFNALLKTLEEPPKHVKFIFCTTDPHKIPITVLSRCQRFDFSPVQSDEIANSLRVIVEREGKTADEEALSLLARRANGSMRDSQSLLEQIFSFCGSHIAVAEVHQLLGTADLGRIAELVGAMIAHDPSRALNFIHQSCSEGIDPGQLAGQLLGFFRDLMAVKLNCSVDTLLMCTQSDLELLTQLSENLGLETMLAMLQILDSAMVKMQSSLHARTLLEMAAIRVCNLENLDAIADLVKKLAESGSPGSTVKPAATKSVSTPPSAESQSTPDLKKNEIVDPISVVGSLGQGFSPTLTPSSSSPHAPASTQGPAPLSSPATVSTAETNRTEPPLMRTDSTHQVEVSPNIVSSIEDTVLVGAGAPSTRSSSASVATNLAKPEGLSKPAPAGYSHSPPELPQSLAAESNLDSSADEEEPFEDSENLSTKTLAELATRDLTQPAAIQAIWGQVAEKLQGMTADMVREPEELNLQEQNVVQVTLRDAYTVRECLKSERKQAIEKALSELCRRPMRVEFRASTKAASRTEAVAPQLPRAQQLRMLLEQDFVKQAVETFAAEVTNFYQRKPN